MNFLKRIFFILLFLTVNLNSQVLISLLLGDELNSGKIEFGLVGGYNLSNISKFENNSLLGTYNLGFYFDVRIKKPWYFYTGVLVKSNLGAAELSESDLRKIGFDYQTEKGDYAQCTNTFLIPLQMRIRFDNNIFLQGGFQLGWMYNAWIDYTETSDNFETEKKYYNKDDLNKLDAGILVGAGYKLKDEKDNGMTFFVQYYYGFIDAYKTVSGSNYSSVFFEATIPIGAE